ncbi:hypothetical protein PFMC_01708 [Plasmodium falciparum CAMP/Malaysia]|uniref:Uncharacterized protein n=1 Tax=Plasmodium falciparum (isolate Camp / Malaysia) TaxID=5835 RepID=A0A024XCK6_PLAFC|nr:hypothetical protein PFMC_01708 [Plasmodium falciparum CAMP/Malaysia]
MIVFDELFEFLREVEITCDNFKEEEEEKEKIILFINELNSYINDLSLSLKGKINNSDDLTDHDILKKIIYKKEALEKAIKNEKDNFKRDAKIKEKVINNEEGGVNKHTNNINNDNMNDKNYDNDGKGDNTFNICNDKKNLSYKDDDINDLTCHPNNKISIGSNEEIKNEYNNNLINGEKKDELSITCNDNMLKKNVVDENITNDCSYNINNKKDNNENDINNTNNNNNNSNNNDNIEILKDDIIKEWGEQIDEFGNLLYEHTLAYKKKDFFKKIEKKKKKKNLDFLQENTIDEELCLLAQEMKENVLTYRDIIKEDNTTLEKSANKQNLTIDSMTDVNKKTQKMTKNKNISFFVSLLIIATSVVLFIFTFFVIILL